MKLIEKYLQLEGQIEPAWCKILKDLGVPALPEFSDEEPNGPVTEVKLMNVVEAEKRWSYHGILVPCEWEALLVNTSVTKRFKDSSEQAGMAARIRLARFHFVELFDPLLPYHYVTWMKEVTADPVHQSEGQLDQREQHFRMKVEIREELLSSIE